MSVLLVLCACQSGIAPRDLDAPIFGGRHQAALLVDTSRAVDIHELARFAKVVRVYKDLTPREMEQVRARLQREVDDLVAVELQTLRPQVEQQKTKLRVRFERDLQAAKDDPAARQRLEAQHQAELQRVEREAREQARERVLARLGKDLALPLPANDSHSVVAFGRMEGEQFQVTSKAYEIDVATSKLKPEAKITSAEGRKATLVGTKK